LAVYTACFTLYFAFVSSFTRSFYNQNRSYNLIVSSFTELTFRYRMLLRMTVEVYRVGYTKWMSKYFLVGSNPDINHMPTFGPDYLSYMMVDYSQNINLFHSSYLDVKKAISDLVEKGGDDLNEVLWGEPGKLTDYNLNPLKNQRYNFSMRPDLSVFIPIAINNMKTINHTLTKEAELLKVGAGWTEIEASPFLDNELLPAQQNYIFVLINAFTSVLPKLEASQKLLFNLILQKQVTEYDSSYMKFLYIFSFITAFNCLCLLVAGVVHDNNIADYYRTYCLLRAEEIELHREMLESKLAIFRQERVNEAAMLNDYIETNWAANTNKTRLALLGKEHKKPGSEREQTVGKKRQRNQRDVGRVKRLKRDRVQLSSLYLEGVNVFYALFILLLILLFLTFNSLSRKLIYLQQFFIKTNELISSANKHLQTYNLLSNFGLYVKIDGKSVFDDPHQLAAENIIHFYTQNKLLHKELLQDYFADIESLLNQDVCRYQWHSDPSRIPVMEAICQTSKEQLGVTGLNSFMLVQKEYMAKVKANTLSLLSAEELERTKTSLVTIPFSAFLEPVFTRVRYLHYLAFGGFGRRISQVVRARLEEINKDLTSLLTSIYIICTLLIVIYVGVSTPLNIYLIRRDYLYATETFSTMSAFMIIQNPYVLNSFKKMFRMN
jgi:hypothetical protein